MMWLDSEIQRELDERRASVTPGVEDLVVARAELPAGTTIDGRAMLPAELLAANRRSPIYDTAPVWVAAWADLWCRLGVPS